MFDPLKVKDGTHASAELVYVAAAVSVLSVKVMRETTTVVAAFAIRTLYFLSTTGATPVSTNAEQVELSLHTRMLNVVIPTEVSNSKAAQALVADTTKQSWSLACNDTDIEEANEILVTVGSENTHSCVPNPFVAHIAGKFP
jgi:hypothetical protein